MKNDKNCKLPLPYCMVNGEVLAAAGSHLSMFDRGFMLGDGVFETMLIKNGEPIWWHEHEQRLAAAAKILSINYPTANYSTAKPEGRAEDNDKDKEKILRDIKKLWRANFGEDGEMGEEVGGDGEADGDNREANKPHVKKYILRLTLSRGAMMERGLWSADGQADGQASGQAGGQAGGQAPPTQAPPTQAPPSQSPPTQAPPTQSPPAQSPPAQSPPTIAMMLYPHQFVTAGAAVTVATITRKNHHSPLTAIKWLGGYGDNILARIHSNADDALLLNSDDNLVSATVGNVFLLFADGWRTPPRCDGIISGIARGKILLNKIAQAKEETIPKNIIQEARAGFISNSAGVRPIASIDGRPLPDYAQATKICQEIMKIYDEK